MSGEEMFVRCISGAHGLYDHHTVFGTFSKMTLKPNMKHQVLVSIIVCSNNDPGLALEHLMASSK